MCFFLFFLFFFALQDSKGLSSIQKLALEVLGLGTHLFINVPRLGDSEGIFSVFRVKLPPVTTSLTTHR